MSAVTAVALMGFGSAAASAGSVVIMGALAWAAVDTPVGTTYIAMNDLGLARVRLPGGKSRPVAGPESARLIEVRQQLADYFDGRRTAFDLPIDWSVVEGFRAKVLKMLYESVPFGAVISYGDLAARAGDPYAAQIVGEVMATNPFPIVVPCHRVVASDGIGGYGGGLDLKRWLLAHEGVLQPMLDF